MVENFRENFLGNLHQRAVTTKLTGIRAEEIREVETVAPTYLPIFVKILSPKWLQ